MGKKKRNRRRNKKTKTYLIVLLACLLVVTAAAGILLYFRTSHTEELPKPEVSWEDLPDEQETFTEEETQKFSEEESSTEEVVYPAPEYAFRTEELIVELPGISKEYTVAWVSDLHMVTDHEAAEDVTQEDLAGIEPRYEFFRTEDGVYGDELLPEIIDFLNYGDFDGILFGGDMLDYCSASNMTLLRAEFGRLNPSVPYLYIRADHDYGFWYGGDTFTETDAEAMHREMPDGDDLNEKYLDFGEFIIIGVNRSTKDMMPGQYDILDAQFAKAASQGKPVIVATHVPYSSKVDDKNDVTLYDKSMEVRGKIYYWGGGDYVPNDVTSAFLDKIYAPDTDVVQVLAGHLHAGWDGMLTDQVCQHIFEPAYLGSIGIVRIVPKGD